MPKRVAAYDLGLNALMLHFQFRYYFLFGDWHPESENYRGIHNCLRWVADDLLVLTPEPPAHDTARKILAVIADFNVLFTEHQQVAASEKPADAVSLGINRIRRMGNELASLTRSMIQARPSLQPYYQLGRAVAFCFLDLMDENRTGVLPGLANVVRAVQNLPDRLVQRSEVLTRLAEYEPKEALSDPLSIVYAVLAKPVGNFEKIHPRTSAMNNLPQLDQKIKETLEKEPDGAVEIMLEAERPYAIFRGIPYPINIRQGLILEEILDGEGAWVPRPAMTSKHPLLESANFRREIKALPPALCQQIESKHHYGYRWLLNTPSTIT